MSRKSASIFWQEWYTTSQGKKTSSAIFSRNCYMWDTLLGSLHCYFNYLPEQVRKWVFSSSFYRSENQVSIRFYPRGETWTHIQVCLTHFQTANAFSTSLFFFCNNLSFEIFFFCFADMNMHMKYISINTDK